MFDAEKIEELRPVAHQHMSMLTASGMPPAAALALAAHVCALVYSGSFDEAIEAAFSALASLPTDAESANS